MKTNIKKILKWVIYYPLLTVVCFEIALLVLGYRRYQTEDYKVEVTPSYAYEANDSLGISLKEGNYSVTLNDSVHFKTTHTSKNQRLTPRTGKDTLADRTVAFLGCSFTYGYGVNNDETFVSALQSQHPNWSLQNYGVIGYGTVQSYIQLEEIIRKGETDAVILNFSSYHFMRNTLTQTYRKNLKIGYAHSAESVDKIMSQAKFPFINSCDCVPQYADWKTMHSNWIGREYLASINWIQTLSEQYIDTQLDPLTLTSCLIQKMHTRCQNADIDFGVVCLDATKETESLHDKLPKVPWTDVQFDFESNSHTFLPYDSHPNAVGHQLIAKKINPFLKELMRDE